MLVFAALASCGSSTLGQAGSHGPRSATASPSLSTSCSSVSTASAAKLCSAALCESTESCASSRPSFYFVTSEKHFLDRRLLHRRLFTCYHSRLPSLGLAPRRLYLELSSQAFARGYRYSFWPLVRCHPKMSTFASVIATAARKVAEDLPCTHAAFMKLQDDFDLRHTARMVDAVTASGLP